LRLCYIANPNSIHTRRWVQYFAQRGHEVHLIGEHALEKAFSAPVIFYDLAARYNVRRLRFVTRSLAVRRILREVRPDLLHAHQVAGAGWLGAASGFHPFIVTAWGSDLLLGPTRYWVHRRLAPWVLKRADYVTCVSAGLADVARTLGANPDRLEVAPWGIDTSVFHPEPASDALRAQLGLGRGPVVLSVRALCPVYNPLDIARAIPDALRQVPDSQFVVRTHIFDPGLLAQFRAFVQQSGITNSVHLVGDLANDQAIAALYQLADVAISVPSSDGTPQSVLEAMACGVAPVLSDVPSLHEWVQDEREGLYVPVGDPKAISAAVVRLLRDDALRHQLRANGLELIRQRADSRVWMAHAEAIYERLLARSA
jgi:glycosyltransferase involved in cell wall biosynthesis